MHSHRDSNSHNMGNHTPNNEKDIGTYSADIARRKMPAHRFRSAKDALSKCINRINTQLSIRYGAVGSEAGADKVKHVFGATRMAYTVELHQASGDFVLEATCHGRLHR